MPGRTPNAAPPGALADACIGADAFGRMRRAESIQIVTLSPEHRETVTTLAPQQIRGFTGRIVDLLRDDRIYTEKQYGLYHKGLVEVRFLDPRPFARLVLHPRKHGLILDYQNGSVSRGTTGRLDPVGLPLGKLLRETAPGDRNLGRMNFSSEPVRHAPKPVLPREIALDLQLIQPGIRRADVLRALMSESGLNSRFHQRFIHRKNVTKSGMLAEKGGFVVAVALQFVPASTPIRWIDGTGYPVGSITQSALRQNEKDDIVTQVSTPQIRAMIGD